jgi:glycosyltransferase involved in cell wall biosynthesis
MKILHINRTDRGGAANACLRLHEGLLNAGIDSKVLVLRKTNNNFREVYEYEFKIKNRRLAKIVQFFKKILFLNMILERVIIKRKRPKSLERLSFPVSNIDITDSKLFCEADIIHLHWVSNILDYKTFFAKCKKPIIWTFHDQNPFLGVEHYAEKLLYPNEQGFPVIRQFNDYELKIEEKYKRLKRKIFENMPMNIIALCNWMKNEITDSQMFPMAKIDIVPNGIDSGQFKILDKNNCKKLLGLPLNKKIILFVAEYTHNNRKGLNYLQKINSKDFLICSVGSKKTSQNKNTNFIELGKFYDPHLMNAAYCAADLYIIPSLMDNLPNTVIESLLSGTPVISFPVGGMPDMIKQKCNGYIAKDISVGALSETLGLFFRENVEWTPEEIRMDAVERFDISTQVKNMTHIYKNI